MTNELAVEKFVNVPYVAVMFDNALIYPPEITALPELKFVACKVTPLIVPPVINVLAVEKFVAVT